MYQRQGRHTHAQHREKERRPLHSRAGDNYKHTRSLPFSSPNNASNRNRNPHASSDRKRSRATLSDYPKQLPQRVIGSHREDPNVRNQYYEVYLAIIDAEIKKGETVAQCASRFGFRTIQEHEEYERLYGHDLGCAPEPPDGQLSVESAVELIKASRDEDARKKRIAKRNEELVMRQNARRRGQNVQAVYARKVDEHGNSTPIVCMKWLQGLCIYGDECPELHTWNENYLPPCAFFATNGFCAREDCPYKHVETERSYYHCENHLRGVECALEGACPDMHVLSKFGSCANSAHIYDEDRLAKPEEVCAAPSYSLAYTPRVAHPHIVVSLNHLVDLTK